MRAVYEKCSAALNADSNEMKGAFICSLLKFEEVIAFMDKLKFYIVPNSYVDYLQKAVFPVFQILIMGKIANKNLFAALY